MNLKNSIPKAFIFDLDGTLIDSMLHHRQSWLQFLHQHGIMLSEPEFLAQSHGTIEEMIRRFFGNDLNEQQFADLCFEKEAMYRRMYAPHLKEIPGVNTFLSQLKSASKKIALATMGNQLNIDFSLDGIGIRKYFDVICGGDDVKNGKPHPEIFELAVTKLNIQPAYCIAFEDTAVGIKSAKDAGLKVVGVATTHHHDELMLMGCDRVIENYIEIDWKNW